MVVVSRLYAVMLIPKALLACGSVVVVSCLCAVILIPKAWLVAPW